MSANPSASSEILERLEAVLVERSERRPDGSYVVQLLDGGWGAIEAKIREEAIEVADAGRDESDDALTREVADLFFHVMVGLVSRGVPIATVFDELGRRFGIGGLEEKAARSGREDEEEGGAR